MAVTQVYNCFLTKVSNKIYVESYFDNDPLPCLNVSKTFCTGTCSVTKLCPTLCNPMGFRLPGSSVHGILKARILEWIAISFSWGSSQSRKQTHIFCIGRWILYHRATREAYKYLTSLHLSLQQNQFYFSHLR